MTIELFAIFLLLAVFCYVLLPEHQDPPFPYNRYSVPVLKPREKIIQDLLETQVELATKSLMDQIEKDLYK